MGNAVPESESADLLPYTVTPMTSSFSWSDTVKIVFVSCLPCLSPVPDQHSEHEDHPARNRIPRARPDELQGLLVDADTDLEAETLSLHSNPGREQRNRKKKRPKKHNNPRRITLFGYNLFGRPIQLPDEDDALYDGGLTPTTIITAQSTSTFDSDAAPLDSDAIAALSSSDVAIAAQASADIEAQRLKEKEERRQRRREKKELRRLAESIAVQGNIGDGDDFEGFQGSGGFMAPSLRKDRPRIPNAVFPGTNSSSGLTSSGSTQEEYGQFIAAPSPPQLEDDNDDADLDGGVYSRKRRTGAGSHGGSDSRSKTSTSTSDKASRNPNNDLTQLGVPPPQPRQSREMKFSRISATTGSSTTSQSPSLPSPISPGFSNGIVSPSTVEQGQGFFDAEDSIGPSIPDDVTKSVGEFPAPRLGGEFPTTGFRVLTGIGAKRTRDLGAFLARRGDENEVNDL